MSECRYNVDEFCVNDQCPMRGDYCPVPDIEGVCQHEDREEEVYKLTQEGCAAAAFQSVGVRLTEEQLGVFWEEFSRLMIREGYAQEVPDDV